VRAVVLPCKRKTRIVLKMVFKKISRRKMFYVKWWALAASVFLSVGFCKIFAQNADNQGIVVGAERLDTLLPMLGGRQIGLVVNHTSRAGEAHLADTLHTLGVCVARIFAPEHGFRGEADAGEHIRDGSDARTGAPIVSLYGRHKKPSAEDFAGLDAVVFDIQDVGARFYTYISTLFYVMETCGEQGVELIVLDRPNPNGHYVDGPVLDTRLSSFVGIAPLPIVHGCTVGELARLFKGEYWTSAAERLRLRVVPCLHYTHRTPYDLPLRPSPNLPTTRSVLLYPSLCLFEGSTASVGRGTEWPFEVIGHPDYGDGAFQFVPRPNAGNKYPLHQGWVCKGLDFRDLAIDSLRAQRQLNLTWLLNYHRDFPNKPVFFRDDNFFDLLAGTKSLRQQIESGKTESEIRATWAEDLAAFGAIRAQYLLYAE
jgi:uncharacterized protein YbbC (DUF1343 family)